MANTPKYQEIAANIDKYTPEELQSMSHADLYLARDLIPRDKQNLISPYEHRAFAREITTEKPWMALPVAAGTLAYQPYKMVTSGARSQPSMNQLTEGFAGVGEGLKQAVMDTASATGKKASEVWGDFQNYVSSKSSRITGTSKDSQATALLESLRSYQPKTSITNTPRQ